MGAVDSEGSSGWSGDDGREIEQVVEIHGLELWRERMHKVDNEEKRETRCMGTLLPTTLIAEESS